VSEESYEVNAAGEPVAEAPDGAANAAMRRQVDTTLRFMAITTLIGLLVIAVLAIFASGIRGVLILVGFVYLLSSLGAYFYLRRTLNNRLERGIPPIQ
jgi:heme/copper-type cytochrome/quinol oxidase subunit 2